MVKMLAQLDAILRGDTTSPENLRQGRLEIDTRSLAIVVVVLGVIYGFCMGSYALLKEVPADLQGGAPAYWQLLATMAKVPALFYLTLLVTFPSLYVFNALVGSRLSMSNVLRLLIASLAVNLAVLASLGPIVLFFSLSTKSYSFVLLLNVVMFTVSGVLGLAFLLQTLNRLILPSFNRDITEPPNPDMNESESPLDEGDAQTKASALDMPEGHALSRHTRLVFGCWIVVFALVGAQMGWVLRPFIGSPNLPFTLFRERKSNFFEAVLNAISALFGGG